MGRGGLDRDAVVGAAADLADAQGWDALTMAALAKRLGIALPSLYTHVRSLGHLRQQVAALACTELAQALGDAIGGRARADALRAFAAAYRAYAVRFPGRYAASFWPPDMADPRHAAATAQIIAVVGATLWGYGLAEPAATDAVRTLRAALHGFASLERAGAFAAPRSLDASFEQMVAALDQTLQNWPPA